MPAMTLRIFVSCTNEKKHAVHFYFIFSAHLAFYRALSKGTPILGIIALLLTIALSTYTIYQTHKGTENAHPKIFKEVGLMVLTLVIILFLGGIAAMLANTQVGMRWGEVAEVVSAIGASFLVGYLIRMGMMKLSK